MLKWLNRILSSQKKRVETESNASIALQNESVLQRIFKHLDGFELYHIQHTCVLFHQVINETSMDLFSHSVTMKQYVEFSLNSNPFPHDLTMNIIFKNQNHFKFGIEFSPSLITGANGLVFPEIPIFTVSSKSFFFPSHFVYQVEKYHSNKHEISKR